MEGKKRTEIAEIGKFGLIERICSRVEPQNASTVKGCGDDTAVIDAGDRYVLLSTELLLEGVAFRPDILSAAASGATRRSSREFPTSSP